MNLEPKHIHFLEQLISKHFLNLKIKVFFFGSRVSGKNQKYSDVDILIESLESTEILRRKIFFLSEDLKESNFPFKTDIVLARDLAESYKDNIEKKELVLTSS